MHVDACTPLAQTIWHANTTALADPAVARRGRLRFNRARGAPFWGGGAAAVRQGGQGLLDRGTLNPDLPLLELFWRSLFPWNTIDNSRQPAQF